MAYKVYGPFRPYNLKPFHLFTFLTFFFFIFFYLLLTLCNQNQF